MLYSRSSHAAGGPSFFFDTDPNIPADAVKVSDPDVRTAINLPSGSTYDFDVAGVLVVTNPTPAQLAAAELDKAKAARLAFIEQEYELREHADIVYMGTTFEAGDESQKLIDRVLSGQGGTAPAGFGWYDITNSKVSMTNAQLQGLANAIFLRNHPLFDNKQAKKAEICAAKTVSEVNAVVW